MTVNPVGLLFIALCVLVGLAFHHWLIGAIVGCGLVLVAEFLPGPR